MIGGSNHIGKSELNTNLNSLVKFLDAVERMNIILTEIPVRYDISASSWNNEQIKQYDRK